MKVIISQIIIGIMIILCGVLSYRFNKTKLSTSMITKISLLIVVSVLLGSIFKLSIPLFGPETFEVKFDTLPLMFIGILFGPWWGFISGGIIDGLQLMITPTGFPFLGFTLNLMLTGMLAGFIFMEKSEKSKNLHSLNQWILIGVLFLAIVFIVLTDQVSINGKQIVFTHGIKWGLAAVIFSLFFVVFIQFKQLSTYHFSQRWIFLVIICEMLIQLLLTVIWLYILFDLSLVVSIPIRLIEAPIMIGIFGIVGNVLKRAIDKVY